MRIVFGIGNPGSRYSLTRHNSGFLLLDQYAQKNSLPFVASKNDYFYAEGKTTQNGFSLIKPTTYVNNSGLAALQAIQEYDVTISDFLVVADDVNLETGKVRIRVGGGDGGHNGLNSIIYQLNSDDFPRLRIGIGNNFGKGDMADYVLSPFNNDEFAVVSAAFNFAAVLIDEFIQGGVKQMLDAFSKISKQ